MHYIGYNFLVVIAIPLLLTTLPTHVSIMSVSPLPIIHLPIKQESKFRLCVSYEETSSALNLPLLPPLWSLWGLWSFLPVLCMAGWVT
jgi:hypothetical protein